MVVLGGFLERRTRLSSRSLGGRTTTANLPEWITVEVGSRVSAGNKCVSGWPGARDHRPDVRLLVEKLPDATMVVALRRAPAGVS